ncbi:MAG: nuclear transport factor 2 family protein [Acidobacteriaceae bacterium]|nr:nuclear transport factor 2 family protein [Acidobacteriaceae bacterium]
MYRAVSYGASVPSPGQDPEATIRGLTQDFCTAFNTGNYDHCAVIFRSDAEFMPAHQESCQGAKAIERILREWGDQGYEDLRLETLSVDSSGDMAVETGRYSVTIRRGTNIVADAGKYLRSWRRLGAWLITADCWSSNLPIADEIRAGQGKVA